MFYVRYELQFHIVHPVWPLDLQCSGRLSKHRSLRSIVPVWWADNGMGHSLGRGLGGGLKHERVTVGQIAETAVNKEYTLWSHPVISRRWMNIMVV